MTKYQKVLKAFVILEPKLLRIYKHMILHDELKELYPHIKAWWLQTILMPLFHVQLCTRFVSFLVKMQVVRKIQQHRALFIVHIFMPLNPTKSSF